MASEPKDLLKDLLVLAADALDIADRCHGGHSYTSGRSEKANKCCDARITVDELKERYVTLSNGKAQKEAAQLTPRDRVTLSRVVGYYLRKRLREQQKRVEKGNVFVPEPGKRDINLVVIENLTKIQQKLLAPPLVDAEMEEQVAREMESDGQ